jgi:ketosteroid isomerase-like protein
MWGQLIEMRLKAGESTDAMVEEIRAAEQPGSGLVRSSILRHQGDPRTVYSFVVFESEEKARAREQDPRRNERLQVARKIMGEILDGPPTFTDLEVVDEWTGVDDGMAGSPSEGSAVPPDEHPNAVVVRSLYDAVQRGDIDTFAGLLHDDIVWFESTPGFEGVYRGPDEVLAMLGRVFEAGVEMGDVSIQDIVADDTNAVIRHDTTMTLGGRTRTASYVDVYRLEGGRLSEHLHLALDPKAEEAFFVG